MSTEPPKKKPDPLALAQLAVALAKNSGKPAEKHLSEALQLIASAERMLRSSKPEPALSFSDAVKLSRMSEKTFRKYLDMVRHDDRAITESFVRDIQRLQRESMSRKPRK